LKGEVKVMCLLVEQGWGCCAAQDWLEGWDQLWVVEMGCFLVLGWGCCWVAWLVEQGWGCCVVLGWQAEQGLWLAEMGCFLVSG
jgi:hypothetical protein